MRKRLFDIIISFTGLVLLSPLFLFIAIWIKTDSVGPVFYLQERVGKNHRIFKLFKFRSMMVGADKKGLITVGNNDHRITKSGCFIRKYKLDELPQLMNVLIGDMSLVGPRPEVKKYVDLYSPLQQKVLDVKPGITDLASIAYFNENELLGKAENPDQTYINEIMPTKLNLNLKYIEQKSFKTDLRIILKTILKIFSE